MLGQLSQQQDLLLYRKKREPVLCIKLSEESLGDEWVLFISELTKHFIPQILSILVIQLCSDSLAKHQKVTMFFVFVLPWIIVQLPVTLPNLCVYVCTHLCMCMCMCVCVCVGMLSYLARTLHQDAVQIQLVRFPVFAIFERLGLPYGYVCVLFVPITQHLYSKVNTGHIVRPDSQYWEVVPPSPIMHLSTTGKHLLDTLNFKGTLFKRIYDNKTITKITVDDWH